MNIAQILQSKCKIYSAKQAIVFEEEILTFDGLDKAVKQILELLKQIETKRGDRVAIQLSKCIEGIYFHIACFALGAITIPLNDRYKPKEIEYFITDSESSLFVTDSQHYLQLKEILWGIPGLKVMTIDEKFPGILFYPEERAGIVSYAEPEYASKDDDTAMILYTSGTTGQPKGAMISHRFLVQAMEDLHEIWRLSDQDVLLDVLPLFHGHGLLTLFQGHYEGATIIIHKIFDPERVWKTIEKAGCTLFMGVPTIYQRMLNAWEELPQKPDISSIRIFISGSAPLSENLFDQFRDTIGYSILERYGTTEAGIIASNPYEDEFRKAKSVGYPLPRVAIRIIGLEGKDVTPGEIGEICVERRRVFNGYWKNLAKTEASFLGEWFKTGDLGYQDPNDDLRLYLVGRSTGMIVSGGYNVYPKEVENTLEKHLAVRETAVVGLPDLDWGEKVVAGVVLHDKREVSEDELMEFCKAELASYKCPKEIYFFEDLPRNTMGKVLKKELKKRFCTNCVHK